MGKRRSKIDSPRLLALGMLFISILYFYANFFFPRIIPRIFRIGAIRQPITILLVGTDLNFDAKTREPLPNSRSRTDSILLLKIDPVNYRIYSLSIPRDSFVSIPGHGQNKINAANVFGGIDLLKQTISNLTGVKIDYYVEINPLVIIRLVDLIGGVSLNVENDMRYVDHAQDLDINLKAGWRKLSGKEAHDFIRFRHDAAGDIGRMERQQKFMQTLFLSLANPRNIIKSPIIIDIAAKNIQTDLPLSKMIRLANFARMISPGNIKAFTASGESGRSDFAGDIIVLNQRDLQGIIHDYFQ